MVSQRLHSHEWGVKLHKADVSDVHEHLARASRKMADPLLPQPCHECRHCDVIEGSLTIIGRHATLDSIAPYEIYLLLYLCST